MFFFIKLTILNLSRLVNPIKTTSNNKYDSDIKISNTGCTLKWTKHSGANNMDMKSEGMYDFKIKRRLSKLSV